MVQAAVDMRFEGDALFVELAQPGERHDLEAAGIGQDRVFPADQLVQTAKPGDPLGGRAQHQVIGIAEDNVGAGVAYLVEIHGLDGADRADRHEGRCADFAARHGNFAEAGAGIGLLQGELEVLGHLSFRKRRLASP